MPNHGPLRLHGSSRAVQTAGPADADQVGNRLMFVAVMEHVVGWKQRYDSL
jgi:hypothetical protein